MNVAPRRPGPLEAAARALLACAGSPAPTAKRGARASAAPPVTPPSASTFFAEMMDLRGTVKLSVAMEKLGDAPPPSSHRRPTSFPPSLSALADQVAAGPRATATATHPMAQAVLDLVEARLLPVETRLANSLQDIVDGKTSLTSGERLVTILGEVDGGSDPLDRVAERAGAIMWAPIQDALSIRLERARMALGDVRAEIGPRLRALGPAADRLERLDAVLAEVTGDARRGLMGRLSPAAERAFVGQLLSVLQASGKAPSTIDKAETSRWFERRGPLHRAVEAARLSYWGLFEHERGALDALVAAACNLGEPSLPLDATADATTAASVAAALP